MSTDNVTPIRANGGGQPPSGLTTKPRRSRRKPPGLTLSSSREDDGFSTLDVLNGLHGVCTALNTGYFENDVDTSAQLQQAALVLSAILQNRVQS
jgi:hypothetical protein